MTKVYNEAQTARELGVSTDWVEKWRRAGLLKSTKDSSGKWQYSESVVAALIRRLAPSYTQAETLTCLGTNGGVLARLVKRGDVVRQDFGGQNRYSRQSVDAVAKTIEEQEHDYVSVNNARDQYFLSTEAATKLWKKGGSKVGVLDGRHLIRRADIPRKY